MLSLKTGKVRSVTQMACVLALLSSFLNYASVQAQTLTADTTRAGEYLVIADSLFHDAAFEEAIAFYQKAANLYKLHDAHIGYATSLNGWGISLNEQYNYRDGLNILKRAESSIRNNLDSPPPVLADIYKSMGNIHANMGQYSKAIDKNQKAIQIWANVYGKTHPKTGIGYAIIGRVAQEQGNFESALLYYQKAHSIWMKSQSENYKNLGKLYNNIGLINYNLGDYNQSIINFQKSLRLKIATYGDDHQIVAHTYNNIGLVYIDIQDYNRAILYFNRALKSQSKLRSAGTLGNLGIAWRNKGEYDTALNFHQKSLAIGLELLGKKHRDIAIDYANIAEVWKAKKDYSKAVDYLEKAIKINSGISINGHPELAYNYTLLAEIWNFKGAYKRAIETSTLALKHHHLTFGTQNIGVIKSYYNLGIAHLNLGHTSNAINSYQKALFVSTGDPHSSKGVFKNPKIGDIEFRVEAVQILRAKGDALKCLYINDQDLKYLEASLETYLLAIDLLDKVRIGYNREASKKDFTEKNGAIFDGAIDVAQLLFKTTSDEKYLHQAFEIAERAKAFILNQSLYERRLSTTFAIPDSLSEKERTLKINIAFYKKDILDRKNNKEGYDTTLVAEFENRLFDLEREFDQLREQLEQDFPKYHQLKYETSTVSVEDIKTQLVDNQALVEYFWGDSTLYAFGISSDKFLMKEMPLDSTAKADLTQLIALTKHSKPQVNDYQEFVRLSSSVYEHVLRPIINDLPAGLSQLTIVPDGPLGNLSFDLLLTAQPEESTNWQTLRYLFRQIAVHHAYSATLLYNNSDSPKVSPSKDLLAFSFGETDPEHSNQVSLQQLRSANSDLPGSLAEIKSIADFIDGDYYFGNRANERQFKDIAGDYHILHLAIHGETDDKEPGNSKLYFYAKGDTLEDGLLHAFELYNMELNADLAVLSACNTGSGQVLAGEGVMSLGRAFSYAGVNSLLLSHWEVSDAIAPDIMRVFYRELKKGKGKSEALRQAKLEFLENADDIKSHPFYWGSFYIQGDNSPITFRDTSWANYYWYLVVAAFLILGVVWWLRKGLIRRSTKAY
ncbi:MAG: CHAT domain-containing tetratricopeptide repeat protein [Bacteroidota bacterium]